MITLKVASFITHKKAESLDDCQDAIKVNEACSRYAVADGATRSFFPKQWAELLVERFCEMPTLSLNAENWKQWLAPIQEEWYRQVEERVQEVNQFYLTNSFSAREPAVSTFIGLEVEKTKREWRAVVIGDSCLFHKNSSGFRSYLIEQSEDFTSRPEAFASFPEANHYNPAFIRGELESGDLFILATDALAKWILEHKESENLAEMLHQLRQIENREEFNQFVDQARDDEKIRLVNDDVALLLISVEASEVSEIPEDEQDITSDEASEVSEIREDEQETPSEETSEISEIPEDDQDITSDTQISEDAEPQAGILEILCWGLLTGVFSVWTFSWIYRFLKDLILTLIQ